MQGGGLTTFELSEYRAHIADLAFQISQQLYALVRLTLAASLPCSCSVGRSLSKPCDEPRDVVRDVVHMTAVGDGRARETSRRMHSRVRECDTNGNGARC